MFASSSDRYSFKGVFKALVSVAEPAGNICNQSCHRSRPRSDRSVDTDTELAADTTRRGELGVPVITVGEAIKHFVAAVARRTQAEYSASQVAAAGQRRWRRWRRGTLTVVSSGRCLKTLVVLCNRIALIIMWFTIFVLRCFFNVKQGEMVEKQTTPIVSAFSLRTVSMSRIKVEFVDVAETQRLPAPLPF